MLRKISFQQFLDWRRYDQLDPFGDTRGDWQVAAICAMLANIAASKGKSKKRFRVQDFLLEWGDERKTPNAPAWQDQKSKAMMFSAMLDAANAHAAKRKR